MSRTVSMEHLPNAVLAKELRERHQVDGALRLHPR